MMKTKSKMNRVPGMRVSLLAAAMAGALLLAGCGGGGNTSSTSTTMWPPATPPATSETNTYIGTQSPGLYSVIIDHTGNTFSYQDLSTSGAAVTGTFTTAPNGFLVLTTSTGATAYALEQLSRAVLLVPPIEYQNNNSFFPPLLTSAPVFAVTAPSCQVIPSRTEFEYLAAANPNYLKEEYSPYPEALTEWTIGAGRVGAYTDSTGANWQFGSEIQYILAAPGGTSAPGTTFSPTPDPFSATCAANSGATGSSSGLSLIQTTLTVPTSVPATFVIGPTGYFVEDRYQSDGVAFVGAAEPQSPIDLSQLSGATFLGVSANAGSTTSGINPTISAPKLVSFAGSGTGTLTGGAFPSNDPAQTPATNYTLNLGAQDPANNGYFPSATINSTPVYALVSNAGGKYSIFVALAGGQAVATSFILLQQ